MNFKPGDYVKPGNMVPNDIHSRTGGRWSDDYSDKGHDQFVWMTKHPEDAHYGSNVYEVHPEGLTRAYNYRGEGEPESRSHQAHVSLAPVKVVRRIGDDEPHIGDTR